MSGRSAVEWSGRWGLAWSALYVALWLFWVGFITGWTLAALLVV